MYKKILFVILGVLTLTNIQTIAKDHRQYFEIYGDSRQGAETYRVKNKLLADFEDLVKGLDESQYAQAIIDNLQENDSIWYENQTISLVLGDGKGTYLSGSLKTNYCQASQDEPLETHFFLWDIWK